MWLHGADVVTGLIDILELEGADVYYRAVAHELIHPDDGTDIGVEGSHTRFDADAIVLATGDYGSSKEKRTRITVPATAT